MQLFLWISCKGRNIKAAYSPKKKKNIYIYYKGHSLRCLTLWLAQLDLIPIPRHSLTNLKSFAQKLAKRERGGRTAIKCSLACDISSRSVSRGRVTTSSGHRNESSVPIPAHAIKPKTEEESVTNFSERMTTNEAAKQQHESNHRSEI